MEESVSMHKNPIPQLGKETGKTEGRKQIVRKAAQQNKDLSEELKHGQPRHSSG